MASWVAWLHAHLVIVHPRHGTYRAEGEMTASPELRMGDQCTSTRFGKRPADTGAAASIGILGDRSDNDLTEVLHRSLVAVDDSNEQPWAGPGPEMSLSGRGTFAGQRLRDRFHRGQRGVLNRQSPRLGK